MIHKTVKTKMKNAIKKQYANHPIRIRGSEVDVSLDAKLIHNQGNTISTSHKKLTFSYLITKNNIEFKCDVVEYTVNANIHRTYRSNNLLQLFNDVKSK